MSAQTAVRTDPAWANQLTVLQGMAQFGMPDFILREGRLDQDLEMLAGQIDRNDVRAMTQNEDVQTSLLWEIYDTEIEHAVQDAYPPDYLHFGFRPLGWNAFR